MPQERLPKQALSAIPNGKRPVGRPRLRWLNHIEGLKWNRLGLSLREMKEVVEDHDVWRLNLELLPPRPSRKSRNWKKKRCCMTVISELFVEAPSRENCHKKLLPKTQQYDLGGIRTPIQDFCLSIEVLLEVLNYCS